MISPAVIGNDTLTQLGGESIFLAKLIYSCSATAPDITQAGDTLSISQGYSGYQWFYGSVPINGATDYFYVATQSGNFNVVVTDCNGCSASAGILNVVASANDISNISNQISITPNPATNTITVSSSSPIKRITIYNTIGEKVWSDKLNSKCKTLNTNFGQGIYFVQVWDGEKNVVRKLIIE